MKQLTRLEILNLFGNDALEKPPGCPLCTWTYKKPPNPGLQMELSGDGDMIYDNKEAVRAFLECLP